MPIRLGNKNAGPAAHNEHLAEIEPEAISFREMRFRDLAG
jgi:hypothetical protein